MRFICTIHNSTNQSTESRLMYRRSKIIKLLINGNNRFKGKIISVTNNRFVNFNVFLDELTAYFRKFLPNGVRRVYKYGSFQMITRIEDLENYGSYICCGNERIRKMNYDANFIESNNFSPTERRNTQKHQINNYFIEKNNIEKSKDYEEEERNNSYEEKKKLDKYPKPVKLVFNDKPQDVIKVFINRNLEISLQDCLHNIARGVNRKLHKHDKVKIFTVSGREITNINDFYLNKSPLLAFTNPVIMYPSDVREMILNLFPGQQRAKRYFSKWLVDADSESSSHSIPLKISSSSSSRSDHSNRRTLRKEEYAPESPEKLLSHREKQYLVKMSARHTEIEQKEKEKHQIPIKSSRDILQTQDSVDGPLRPIFADRYSQVTPINRGLHKGTQVASNVKYFDKITQFLPRVSCFPKMTQISFNPRTFEKMTQVSISARHFDKMINVYPSLAAAATMTSEPASFDKEDKSVQCSFETRAPSTLSGRSRTPRPPESRDTKQFFLSEKYELIEILSESSRSTVFLSEESNKERRVIKRIPRLKGDTSWETEAQTLLACNNDNIIKCFEVFRNEMIIEIVMEYASDGNVESLLTSRIMKEPETRQMIKDVSRGLLYLHSVGLVHRDIEPKNIFCNLSLMRFKIGGFSRVKKHYGEYFTTEEFPVTIYTAPEMSVGERCTEKIDIWSLGVILCNIVCEKYLSVQSGSKFIFENDNPNWVNWERDCLLLVTEMLQDEPEDRVGALDVACYPWVIGTGDVQDVREQLVQDMEFYAREYNEPSII